MSGAIRIPARRNGASEINGHVHEMAEITSLREDEAQRIELTGRYA
jgi:hypothetical protein